MNLSRAFEYVLLGVLGILLVSLLASHLVGYPVLLGHVDSSSMEPTLNEGDGFIAVPAPLAGDVGVGDVVTFEAENVQGGEITTHRIVEDRPEGYITQGDNNPFPDQSTDDPPVTDGQVKTVALSIDGEVVRIPHLGTATDAVSSVIRTAEGVVADALGVRRLGTQELSYLLFAAGLLAFVTLFLTEQTGRRDRDRERSRARAVVFDTSLLLAGGLLFLCAGATVGMVGPAGTETFGIVSAESNASSPTIIPVGESDSLTQQVGNGGYLPTVSYFDAESNGIAVEPERVQLSRDETVNATVTLTAPGETGYYLRSMTEHRYLVVLPPPVIDAAHGVHPWVPYLLVNAVIAAPFVLLWLIFGRQGSTLRLRSRERERTSGFLR